jgi:hypothetical protein
VKRLILLVVVVALGVAWAALLPERGRELPGTGGPLPVRGAFHVHTDRSDGTGSVEDVAAAAARAGLSFVVLTDHGDATREPLDPEYHSGVLVIDAVEISTVGGHVVALDLPVSGYPLGGEPRDVVEDIARGGGFAIAAHPESAKTELRWTEWTAPFGGLEWLNGDSEWRDEEWPTLARALFTYPWRATATLAALLDRPENLLRRWDVLTGRRRVVAVAAADAHARVGLRSLGEPYDSYQTSTAFRVPSYEQMFRAFSIALPGVALTADAAADAKAVTGAIRAGHAYSVVNGLGSPGILSFTGASNQGSAIMGDVLADANVTLRVGSNAPADARIDLLWNGEVIASAQGSELEHMPAAPGAYRVELFLPGVGGSPAVPWMLSNPIYVGRPATEPAPIDPRRPATTFTTLYENGPAGDWTVETSTSSKGVLEVIPTVGGTQLSLRYAVGGALSQNPYVALVAPAGAGAAASDRITFTARATRPMRVSVQLRIPGPDGGQRWHRSIYLEPTPRTVTVHFDDMTPLGATPTRRPTLSEVRSILWVVDAVNTALGGSGEILLDEVRYGR